MTNAQMMAEVVKMLGNISSNHPFYSDVQVWVNRGIQDVVLMGIQGLSKGIDHFPELRCSWVSDLSIAGTNNQALPADKLIITSMASFDKATAVNLNTDRALPMNYVRPEKFDILVKDATRTGYPRIWTMRGRSFLYHPTPSASPTDYRSFMHLWGIERDPYPDFVNPGDTPKISSLWHDVCVTRAAAIGARRLNWPDRAQSWDNEVKMRLGLSTDIGATEDAAHLTVITVEGLIGRSGIYGSDEWF